MAQSPLQKLIEQIVKEELVELDRLHDGVSTSTITGKAWFNLISSLESVMNEVKDFKDMYRPSLHGPTPDITTAMLNLQQVVQILEDTKHVIIGMDDIERKDL